MKYLELPLGAKFKRKDYLKFSLGKDGEKAHTKAELGNYFGLGWKY